MARAKGKITYAHSSPTAVEKAVEQLGANIASARIRRRWRQEDLARKAGITRATLSGIERGNLGTGIGAYIAALWGLGLDNDIRLLAAPERDSEGRTLEAARLGQRAHPSTELSDEF